MIDLQRMESLGATYLRIGSFLWQNICRCPIVWAGATWWLFVYVLERPITFRLRANRIRWLCSSALSTSRNGRRWKDKKAYWPSYPSAGNWPIPAVPSSSLKAWSYRTRRWTGIERLGKAFPARRSVIDPGGINSNALAQVPKSVSDMRVDEYRCQVKAGKFLQVHQHILRLQQWCDGWVIISRELLT